MFSPDTSTSSHKQKTNKHINMTTIENTCGTPMTPSSAEVTALTSGTWHMGWTHNAWTPITNFEQLWALAQTTQARALLLDTYFPLASETLTAYQRSILMSVNLPATKSNNPAAELTFCDGTIRQRVCGFAYCVEDTPGGEGYWYCDECRNYGKEEE
jgi:hypothetical protein